MGYFKKLVEKVDDSKNRQIMAKVVELSKLLVAFHTALFQARSDKNWKTSAEREKADKIFETFKGLKRDWEDGKLFLLLSANSRREVFPGIRRDATIDDW